MTALSHDADMIVERHRRFLADNAAWNHRVREAMRQAADEHLKACMAAGAVAGAGASVVVTTILHLFGA